MYRQALSKAVRPALRSSLQSRAAFSTTTRAMAGGDTGATRSTGAAGGLAFDRDAFTKREKANEDYAIRMREKEKLLELKKKLAEQHEHLKKLEEHIDEISKGQGGEQK
ncbi:mitochondrial ATPase inhibitor, IATP-domain-containing protein [Rhexocercosporidium sp. MPI-PUGE-AT-0058]|nr:mitochondrial ATPase inhibitor, IATP-domain-containing protein [Rhexocercosporidium sp. MPI-PUGE-AT-0058]